MNKMSQDKMFLIILVCVFAAGMTFLGALRMSDIGEKDHHAGAEGHGGEAPVAAAPAAAPAGH